MNRQILWRMIWKEYRTYRGFWLSLFLFAASVLFLPAAFGYHIKTISLLALAIGTALFYAVGCFGTLFATEHEEGTYDFLRVLPATWTEVFSGKVLSAAGTTVALVAILLLSAAAAAIAFLGSLPSTEELAVVGKFWGWAILQALAWGLFFSLLLRQPLTAVLLSVGAIVLTTEVLLRQFELMLERPLTPSGAMLPYYSLGISLALFLVDVWLAKRWYPSRAITLKRPRLLSNLAHLLPDRIRQSAAQADGPFQATMLARLVWQSLHENAGLLASFAFLAFAMSVAIVRMPSRPRDEAIDTQLAMGALVLIGMSAPSCVFLRDQQQRRYRFFAERGIAARRVWLSRQLVWFSVFLVLALVSHLVIYPRAWIGLATSIGTPRGDRQTTGGIYLQPIGLATWLGFWLLLYGAGQFCSMLVRSGIVAVVAGPILALILLGWAWIMTFMQISWLWSVLPFPLLLLLFTRLHARDWLLERGGWRTLRRAALVLLLPFAVILFAVRVHRVDEFPPVDVHFAAQPQAPASPAQEQAALDLYRKALEALQPMMGESPDRDSVDDEQQSEKLAPYVTNWVDRNPEAIRLALLASRGPFEIPLSLDREARGGGITTLEYLLEMAGCRDMQEGRLDEAWQDFTAALRIAGHRETSGFPGANSTQPQVRIYQRLPYWAARPEQTPERIEKALRELEELDRSMPSPKTAIETIYRISREAILSPQTDDIDRLGWMEWSGERERSLRGLHYLMRKTWLAVERVEEQVRQGQPLREPVAEWAERQYGAVPMWANNTFFLERFARNFLAPETALDFLYVEANRRAARVIMAIEAWRFRHGQLPAALDQLVGETLKSMPLDPFSGRPFAYVREGIPIAAFEIIFVPSGRAARQIAANRPFIWCTGPRIRYHELEAGHESIQIYDGAEWQALGSARNTAYTRWTSGWMFEIP